MSASRHLSGSGYQQNVNLSSDRHQQPGAAGKTNQQQRGNRSDNSWDRQENETRPGHDGSQQRYESRLGYGQLNNESQRTGLNDIQKSDLNDDAGMRRAMEKGVNELLMSKYVQLPLRA